MKNIFHRKYKIAEEICITSATTRIIILLLCFSSSACKKLADVPPPTTRIAATSVYQNETTAIAVLTGLYSQMSNLGINTGGLTSLSLLSSLSADELSLVSGADPLYTAYYSNKLLSNNNSSRGVEFWNVNFPFIYETNEAIEQLSINNTLLPAVKQQLLGEAKFMRAFYYFYLVNLYGDIPLAISSDYSINTLLPKSPKEKVYQQIVADLKDSQTLLSANYVDVTLIKKSTERVRPTSWAATALLARTYLYLGDLNHDVSNYANAEAQATTVINNTSLFGLSSLDTAFLKNNKEAIWQLQPVKSYTNTLDAPFFILPSTGPSVGYPVYLSNFLVSTFELGDLRKSRWTGNVYVSTTNATYYYPYKYKKITDLSVTSTAKMTEYTMILRLGEQYLIRAEARAQQGKITGSGSAESDLNIIRSRAGLTGTTATTQTQMLTAILHERQVELFAEWGNRWFDLKRTGKVDQVMPAVTSQKGGTWSTNWQSYPIPFADLKTDPNLIQNPGY